MSSNMNPNDNSNYMAANSIMGNNTGVAAQSVNLTVAQLLTMLGLSIPVAFAQGGTGANITAVNGGILYSGASVGAVSAAGSAGQAMLSGGAGAPTWTTATYPATAGTAGNVMTSDGTNFVSSAPAGSALPLTVVSGTTQALAVNNGYASNNAGLVTMTLPGTAAVGNIIEVTGLGAGGWLIAQNASQIIHYNSVSSTAGVGGSLASTARYNTVTLQCVVANLEFNVISGTGNITVV